MVKYTNRKNKTYYLYVGKTKTEKPKYYFSMKSKGNIADEIPKGFEIWESPVNAQVFLKRHKPKLFTDIEIEIVRKYIRENLKDNEFKVDAVGDSLIIYLDDGKDERVDALMSIVGSFAGKKDRNIISGIIEDSTDYQAMMRFSIEVVKDIREYSVDRWCFKGSIDDWYFLDSSNDLRKLAKKYCKHLGKESFYELM